MKERQSREKLRKERKGGNVRKRKWGYRQRNRGNDMRTQS